MPSSIGNSPRLRPIKDTFAEILALQVGYSPNNTEQMQRRGFLVRRQLRDQIFARIEKLEPIFDSHGYKCEVEGKDGIGRKAMSAWTRIYDPRRSPSATTGWYIVIHFSSRGDYFYLTLGRGATKFRGGSLEPVDPAELSQKIQWARRIADGRFKDARRFHDEIKLHGNHLSAQFEAATALAKRYSPEAFSEGEFWTDLEILCRILVQIYDAEQSSLGLAHAEARKEEPTVSTEEKRERKPGRGQGFYLSHEERIAVERRAMTVVKQELVARSFTKIRDTSAVASYDLEAFKDSEKWYIEVKGTTSPGADSFLLTANELDLHQKNKGYTILAIVHHIELVHSTAKPEARGGELLIEAPWNPDSWDFRPTAYSAVKKLKSNRGRS